MLRKMAERNKFRLMNLRVSERKFVLKISHRGTKITENEIEVRDAIQSMLSLSFPRESQFPLPLKQRVQYQPAARF